MNTGLAIFTVALSLLYLSVAVLCRKAHEVNVSVWQEPDDDGYEDEVSVDESWRNN